MSRPSQTSYSLIDRICASDQSAWEQFVDIYGPTLYGWCRGSGLGDEDSADVIQDIFRAVARGIDRFERQSDRNGSFAAWLWAVTQSKIKNHRQRIAHSERAIGGSEARRHFAEVADALVDVSDIRGSSADDVSIVLRTAELIRSEFKESTWQAFWRVAVDDQRTDVVAAQLNMSVAAVRQANYRVRRRLRQELEQVSLPE